MVTSGLNSGYTCMDSTEVIDLTTGKTFNMPSLGRRTYGATGGLLDGLPLVCGGVNHDQIHSINKEESKSLGHLSVIREYAASVVLSNNTLWVTGGFDQSDKALKTTDLVTKEGKTSKGPDLPLALCGHAIAALNSGVFILIGGSFSAFSYSSATYFYEEKKGWRPGPNLKNARYWHTAGVLTDRVSTKQYIVAVGGRGAYSSLEYLEYPGSNDWMQGKPTH